MAFTSFYLIDLPSVPSEREAQVLGALATRCRGQNIPVTRRQVAEILGENQRRKFGVPDLVTPILHALVNKGWARIVDYSNCRLWDVTPAGRWHLAKPEERRWLAVGPSKARLINRAAEHRNALKSLIEPYRELADETLLDIASVPASAPKKHRDAAFVATSILSARASLAEAHAAIAAAEAEAR